MALAPEAQQFFIKGEPELADRYFPWLVNLMSPVYWIYFAMAATIIFNAMRGFSRFRLWRIDSQREKLKANIHKLGDTGEVRSPAVDGIRQRLGELRERCRSYTGSFVTPMGDEMFYRYQERLIDELLARLSAISGQPTSTAAPKDNRTKT